MATPRVSIGMAAYNGEAWIDQSLAGLATQDFPDFELIVSDDGSTDGTCSRVQAWAARDPRIRLVRQPANLGVIRNHAFLEGSGQGEYFLWANDHDLHDPSYLRRCVEVLDAEPGVVLCCGQTAAMTESGQGLQNLAFPFDTRGLERADRLAAMYHAALRDACFFYGVFRAQELRRSPGHRSTLAGDLVFLAEMALYGDVVRLGDIRYYRRKFGKDDPASAHARWIRTVVQPRGHGLEGHLPYLDTAYEYVRTLNRADLPLDEKNALMTLALELVTGTFGSSIRHEVSQLLPLAQAGLAQAPPGPLRADFAKAVLEATTKATLVLGDHPALRDLGAACLAVVQGAGNLP